MKAKELATAIGIAVAALVCSASVAQAGAEPPYTETFDLEHCHLKAHGVNDYFLRLKPGCWLLLAGEDEGEEVKDLIQVLPDQINVDGAHCAVIRETEWADDEVVEISSNYIAICEDNKGVFYFGEDVNLYEDGEVVSHEGSWRAGVDGAKPGLLMPGQPLIGSRYYQEMAPNAQDRAEHLDNEAVIATPAGTFEHCLYVVETSPLEPGDMSFKAYAPGIGLVMDDVIRLVDWGCKGHSHGVHDSH